LTTVRLTVASAAASLSLLGFAPAQEKESATRASPALESPEDKLSYAVGVSLGDYLRKRSADVDVDLIARGLADTLSDGRTLLTDAEARVTAVKVHRELEKSQVARQDADDTALPGAAPRAGITVAFKLDPRLTQGLYMGERWVSPPTFMGAGDAHSVTVEARAEGRDARGRRMRIAPRWTPADPHLVTVIPREGNEARITVHGPGQSSLEVASPEFSRTLQIKAEYRHDVLLVEIAQGQGPK
jgi:hypothetical protein